MKKTASIFLAILISLAACAHETTAHKDVAEEKIVFAPDPPPEDAGTGDSIDDGTKKPDPPNVFANGHRAVLSDKSIKNFWQVPMDLAKYADAKLEDYLRVRKPNVAAKLSHYDAQIYGERSNGKQSVVFYMMSRDTIRIGADGSQNSDDWIQHHADVYDGFDDFFSVYFDVDSGRF